MVEKSKNLIALKRLMRRHRLTCPRVAELIDYKPQTVRAWRSGRYPVPSHVITVLNVLLENQ